MGARPDSSQGPRGFRDPIRTGGKPSRSPRPSRPSRGPVPSFPNPKPKPDKPFHYLENFDPYKDRPSGGSLQEAVAASTPFAETGRDFRINEFQEILNGLEGLREQNNNIRSTGGKPSPPSFLRPDGYPGSFNVNEFQGMLNELETLREENNNIRSTRGKSSRFPRRSRPSRRRM